MFINNRNNLSLEHIETLPQNIVNLKYFNILLDNSIVLKMSLSGYIIYINDRFTNVMGYTKDDIIGKHVSTLQHPNFTQQEYDEIRNTLKDVKVWRGRILQLKKDGTDVWFEVTLIPLQNEDGKIVEILSIKNDITDFLQMKRKLHNKYLQEEKQRKITEAKDSFLILFSHELKTPLNAIINFTKYLLKHARNNTLNQISIQKRKELLKQIELSAYKMLDDITKILDLEKLKSNKLTYNLSIFNLEDALKDVINNNIYLANEYGVDINTIINYNTQSFIKSDAYRFKQILSNILSNAIKFSRGKVEINIYRLESGTIELSIEDNGKGLSKEEKKKIFTLFEQISDSVITRSQKGTGIGLSFVKLLCKDLNIQYKLVDSSKLGGLKFKLIMKEIL